MGADGAKGVGLLLQVLSARGVGQVVMWHTELPARSATVEYALQEDAGNTEQHVTSRRLLAGHTGLSLDAAGPGIFGSTAVGVSWPFVDGGVKQSAQTLYRVVLTGLQAGAPLAHRDPTDEVVVGCVRRLSMQAQSRGVLARVGVRVSE